MLGESARSNRVGSPVPPTPSLASTWNSAFVAVPQKELLVVHGTVFAPPPWSVDHPAGNAPGAVLLKSSANIVAAIGVPVSTLKGNVVLPPPVVVTASERSMRVPATKPPES